MSNEHSELYKNGPKIVEPNSKKLTLFNFTKLNFIILKILRILPNTILIFNCFKIKLIFK